MTHLSARRYLCGLIILLLIIAFFKLAMADDWYSFLISFCTAAGILLQWAVTKDDRPSVKKGDEE